LKSVFPSFKGFTEHSFQNGEYGFDFVSLMVFFIIECLSDSSSIMSGDPFTFSISDRDKGTGVEGTPDQFMNLFRVIILYP
jgi:hypothetical protein